MSHYIGRFAPSPTGHLHAGSLACLLASYLDAKAHRGTWIIRVEDIDPPREPAWAAEDQLETIEAFKLHSDRPILRQSTRIEAYQQALNFLTVKVWLWVCLHSQKNRSRLLSCRLATGRLSRNLSPWNRRCTDSCVALSCRRRFHLFHEQMARYV